MFPRLELDMHYIFLALTNPEESRDDEFNAWYSAHHVAEVLRYGRGFLKARRYRRELFTNGGDGFPWQYLALYEMVSEDLRAYHQAPWTRLNPPLTPFRGLLKDDHAAWIYRPYVSSHAVYGNSPRDQGGSPVERATALVFALARVDSGRELAFNEWLDHTHIPNLRARSIAATVVQRYVLAEHQRPSQAASYWKYLTAYELAGGGREQLRSLNEAVNDVGVPKDPQGPLWAERRVCAWTAISGCYHADTPGAPHSDSAPEGD
jgi:hypothetical protein